MATNNGVEGDQRDVCFGGAVSPVSSRIGGQRGCKRVSYVQRIWYPEATAQGRPSEMACE